MSPDLHQAAREMRHNRAQNESAPAFGRWCGPTALAIVAGISYSEARAQLGTIERRLGGRNSGGVRILSMDEALGDLGAIRSTGPGLARHLHRDGRGLTVRQWLRRYHVPDCFTILWITSHYVVLWGNTLADNQLGPTPIQSRFQRHRVKGFWRCPF